MTPYSAAAGGSFSRRASSRSTAFRASSGSPSAVERARAARRPPPALGRPRRAPPGSPSAAGAGRTRAGPSPSPTATCDWIFEPSSNTSSSRFRIRETSRSRVSTSASSSSRCFSSVFSRSVEATRCVSAPGSSTFAAASCSSSGRYGHERDDAREQALDVARQRLDLAASRSATSGSSLELADRGTARPARARSSRTRCRPWTRMRSVPSGTRIILWTTAAVPTS